MVICRVRCSFPDRKDSCKLLQAAARLHGERGRESDAFPSMPGLYRSIDRRFPRVVPEDIDSCEVVGRFSRSECESSFCQENKMLRNSYSHRMDENTFSAEMYHTTTVSIFAWTLALYGPGHVFVFGKTRLQPAANVTQSSPGRGPHFVPNTNPSQKLVAAKHGSCLLRF
jgi:hypothetical protein